MLRHISNINYNFLHFLKRNLKKIQDGRLYLLQEKTTIQRRQAFQQHAAFLSSLPDQECLTGKFSKGIVCQLDGALSTLFTKHYWAGENMKIDFLYLFAWFMSRRLWTNPVGKFHTIFRGLKGNRVLYGNSFESDDTEDFPKASKPYIWPDISPTLLFYADIVIRHKNLRIHAVRTRDNMLV